MPSIATLTAAVLCLPVCGHALAAPGARASLATFDGAAGTTFKWSELNDPVMGGRSSGTFHVNTTGGYGVFSGDVVDVPSLKAPGFIKTAADGTFANLEQFATGSLVLLVRTSTPQYAGFRVSFAAGSLSPAYSCAGGGGIPLSRGCFKTNFTVPAGAGWSEIRLPFNTFSDEWSSATGAQTKTCAQNKDVCPTAAKLREIKRVEVWGEGALGRVQLDIKAIYAESAGSGAASAPLSTRPPKEDDHCSAAVQPKLRYSLSGRQNSVPAPADPSETLADAVCCDTRALPFAEPQFLFSAPDVMLFSKLSKEGVTTFYDSVCGLPLFKAPFGRTLQEFQQDTQAHGWPSFRPEEVVLANVRTDNATGAVSSKCGTHLGSFLPDDKGPRWCIDLTCIAGNPL